jgi:hypothetical protein
MLPLLERLTVIFPALRAVPPSEPTRPRPAATASSVVSACLPRRRATSGAQQCAPARLGTPPSGGSPGDGPFLRHCL